MAIGTLAGVPLTMFSTLIIKNLGHHKIVIFALVLYGIRLFGYAELSQAETFLAFEVAKPFCTTLLLISGGLIYFVNVFFIFYIEITSDSKKLGQSAVVIHYCGLSQFF